MTLLTIASAIMAAVVRHYARHGDSIAPPVVWTLLHVRGLGARSFSLCLREASRSARNLTKRAS